MAASAFITGTPALPISGLAHSNRNALSARRPSISVQRASPRHGAASLHMKIGIFYSSVTGNTMEAANAICEALGEDKADDALEIDEVSAGDLADYDALIVGAPTWNTGVDIERSGTAMDDFLYGNIEDASLTDMPVAVFGLGDAQGYGDNFCDAIEELHDVFEKNGAKMVGYTGTDGVEFKESKSIRDGKFLGLALDYMNDDERELKSRIAEWCKQVVSEAKL